MKVAVIGGGAAGFFAALSVKEHHPDAEVHLFEKTGKFLSKVKVSGGGRCNVTHAAFERPALLRSYPRGQRFLKKAFHQFMPQDTVEWFKRRGVELKTEEDGRMFPTTDDSQTIIDLFLKEAERTGVRLRLKSPVQAIVQKGESWELDVDGALLKFDKVIIASGGSPKREGLKWLEDLGHSVVEPVPSLFTFNLKDNGLTELAGVSVPDAVVKIRGTKHKEQGPLLITHWGLSGPAVLRTSAFAARDLFDLDYEFTISVNWHGSTNEEELRDSPQWMEALNSKRKLRNENPVDLPERLWLALIERSGSDADLRWLDLSKKGLNRLINTLTNDEYAISGKTTFKEEFVTAGGVNLSSVEPDSCRSRVCDGLYFAGEVLDIDGVTGGFNFQAAWTTAWIAGKLN